MRLFHFDSLNKKLVAIFLSLTIIPLVITVAVIFYDTEKSFTEITNNQQKEMEHTVQAQFDKVADDLLNLTTLYAKNEELTSAFQTGDREKLLKIINQIYPRLQEEHGLNVFEIGDASGTVFLRGHNPEKYGDDKSDIQAIQYALDGKAISGFEFGSSGLAVRAFAPITNQNKVIGTLQTGVDSSFLQELHNMLPGLTINLYNEEGVIAVSSDEKSIGNTLNDSSALSSAMKGKTQSTIEKENLVSFLPMYEPTQSSTIGAINFSQDISVIQDSQKQITMISLIMAIFTLVVVLFVSLRYSKTISKPIKYVSELMEQFSEGNLSFKVNESNRKDEIGLLIKSMGAMKDNLREIIEKVAQASTSVASQSEELTQSANEVKTGSKQIAITMQELATGTEKQADKLSELTSTMGGFKETITDTNKRGEKIHEVSFEVLDLTKEGKQLMDSSNQQMLKIDEIVQEAVKKMNSLDGQMKQIFQLVSIIQDVANQTNLLALNAAIEAARAGEHGKGFSVVAEEVRKLAEQVSSSVTDITGIVQQIQNESSIVVGSLNDGYKEVKQGSNQIKTTGETFNQINSSVSDMVDNIKDITSNLSQIVVSSQQMNESIGEIAAISEESAAGVEQTAATTQQGSSSMEEVTANTEQLAKLAEELNGLVKHFKL